MTREYNGASAPVVAQCFDSFGEQRIAELVVSGTAGRSTGHNEWSTVGLHTDRFTDGGIGLEVPEVDLLLETLVETRAAVGSSLPPSCRVAQRLGHQDHVGQPEGQMV